MLPIAAFVVFAAIVCLVLAFSWREESPLETRMAALRGERPTLDFGSFDSREPSRVGAAPFAGSVGVKLERLLPLRWTEALERGLARAGQPATVAGFLGAVFIVQAALVGFAVTIIVASGMAMTLGIVFIALSAALGAYLPRIWLSNRVKHRQKEILKSLPDAFDLITVCVEAGLGLDAALARVAEKVEGPFGEELAITLKEVSLGKLRREALKELGERIVVADLTTFINAVVQAETMGTSIATVLRVQADQMRIRRRQRAEQQAMAAPIKMMFPLVLCIFPSLFIVILGPAGIQLYEQLVKK